MLFYHVVTKDPHFPTFSYNTSLKILAVFHVLLKNQCLLKINVRLKFHIDH